MCSKTKQKLKLNFFGCLVKKINIVISGALKLVWEPLIVYIKYIVRHFKRSSTAGEKLMTNQKKVLSWSLKSLFRMWGPEGTRLTLNMLGFAN